MNRIKADCQKNLNKANFCWEVGGMLRDFRKMAGLSLEKMAKRLGLNADQLDDMEWGHLDYKCRDYAVAYMCCVFLMFKTPLWARNVPGDEESSAA